MKKFIINTFNKELEVNLTLKNTLEYVEKTLPEATVVVAGGFFRDTYLNTQVEDIDVFVLTKAYPPVPEIPNVSVECSASGYENVQSNMTSYKLYTLGCQTVNLVYDHTSNSGEELIDRFAASYSKLGYNLTTEEVYTEGFKSIDKGVCEFYMTDSVTGLLKYMEKLTKKPWADVFCYNHFGIFKEYFLTKDFRYERTPLASELAGAITEYGFLKTINCEVDAYSIVEEIESFVREVAECAYAFDSHMVPCALLTPREYAMLVAEGYLVSRDVYSFLQGDCKSLAEGLQRLIKSKNEHHLQTGAYIKPLPKGWDFLMHLPREKQELFVQGYKRKVFTPGERVHSSVFIEYVRANGLSHLLPYSLDTYQTSYTIPRQGVKASVFKGAPRYTIYDLSSALEWAVVLGNGVVNLDSYFLGHFSPIYYGVKVLDTFKVALSKSTGAMRWVFEQGLEVDYTVSKSLKKCVLIALQKKYSVNEQLAEQLFNDPSIRFALEFASKNPNEDIQLNSVFPREVWETDKYTLEMLPKTDITNLTIGILTSCCQYISGVGSSVCTQGWIDPNSVNYVIRSKDSGKIYAHFWAWASQDGHIIIDSVEGRKSDELTQHTVELIKQFSHNRKGVLLSTTHYGFTRDVIDALASGKESRYVPSSASEYRYKDATTVYAISQEIPYKLSGHKLQLNPGEVNYVPW